MYVYTKEELSAHDILVRNLHEISGIIEIDGKKKNQVSKKVNYDNKSSKLFSLEICIFCCVEHAFQRDPIERADHFTGVVLNVMHTLAEKKTSAICNPFQLKSH